MLTYICSSIFRQAPFECIFRLQRNADGDNVVDMIPAEYGNSIANAVAETVKCGQNYQNTDAPS